MAPTPLGIGLFPVSSMSSRALLLFAGFVFLQVTAGAQDIQSRVQAMLDRARQLSDIRSPVAPAFRLKATFSFVGDDLDPVQGTYTETWVSDSQWRRETVVGNLRHIEVGDSDKRWLLFPDEFPGRANKVAAIMAFLPPASAELDFISITERTAARTVAECAFTKPIRPGQQSAFCFEQKTGILLENAYPDRRPRNIVMFSCDYGDFKKFGTRWFPHEAVCFEDRHKTITANVVELTIEPPLDPALFDKPSGAIELDRCSGKTVPPTLESPMLPRELDPDRLLWVRLWFVVDKNGRPLNMKAARVANKGAYEKALNTVRAWRFNPGTCDGKPILAEMTVEVPATPK
jgi:hypothetical protein